MARPLRIESPGSTYHVTNRGNEQRSIFRDDDDRRAFLRFLAETIRRCGWSLSAWVLMTNHFHLVIQTPEPNLSRGMHWLETCYASWFNRRHRRSGHLFQGRFTAIVVEKEQYFTRLMRYVVMNPVAARLVARPEDYTWSSYRAVAGFDPAPDWLDVAAALEPFTGVGEVGQAAWRQYVLERLGTEDPLWAELQHGIFLGTECWAKLMRKQVEARPRSTDHPLAQRAVGRPAMHRIVETVADVAKTTCETIRRERGHPLRALIAWLGWNEGLHTLSAIAASLRMRSDGHMSNLVRRCEKRFSGDADYLRLLDLATAALRA